ncbi:MAG: helix-turn-helix transcriptional regulator [Acidobacteria bacterium]|nr:helix-turn-helix transcriptional regulator [Acidobacteriota bacterium]
MGRPRRAYLAPRQFEIADLVARGRTNKEIALALNISAHTVRNTLLTIFERLGVDNRVRLARMVTLGQVTRVEEPLAWQPPLPYEDSDEGERVRRRAG